MLPVCCPSPTPFPTEFAWRVVQATESWSSERCCADGGNYCPGAHHSYCTYSSRTASNNFVFRLSPGEPERFLTNPSTVGHHPWYQYARPDRWPAWGNMDLEFGMDGPLGGNAGACSRYNINTHVYTAAPNEVCGGYHNWGSTDLEVWYPVATAPAGTGH
jgi:hypothetical protein